MSIASGPVKRPVLTFVIFLIVIIIGLVSLSRLPIDLMPEITYPTISVRTNYGNVGPQEIEDQITRPIEEAVAAVQNVEEITSTSSEGTSNVRIAFAWGTDLETASNDIRDRIDRIINSLPEGIERPRIRKFDLAAYPVLYIGVAGNMDQMLLSQLVDDQITYRLERLNGVATVEVRGDLNREIHITLSSQKMKAYGLSISAIKSAINNENQNTPLGLISRSEKEVLLRATGEFTSLDEIKELVITTRDGHPIKISDIAEVSDSHEEITRLTRINGEPGLRFAISKQSGANTVEVAETIKKELKRLEKDYPQIRFNIIIDSSKYIKQSITNMGFTVLIGGFLAIIILFLFLRNITSTAIIATAIPVSIIATFALLYFNNLTLNIMTFGGLALGIGMLVDSSIVVLENIYRQKENGLSDEESALKGTDEVWSAILASTLTTIVVFLPVVFVRGISGIMFQQMAIVVSFALLCSLIVSLTLIPMLSSRFLKYHPVNTKKKSNRMERIYRKSEEFLKKIEYQYSLILAKAMKQKKLVIILTFSLFLISVFMLRFIGVELMPETDEGEVRVDVEMALGTKLEIVEDITIDLENKIKQEVPEMVSMLSRIGGGGWRSSGGNTSQIRVTLLERGKRKRSSEEIATDLRMKLKNIPGVNIRTRAAGGLWVLRLGQSSDDNLSLEIRGHDLEEANKLAIKMEEVLNSVPGITDTDISREEGNPEQVIRVDREKAADLGLSIAMIGDALQAAISGTHVSYFRQGGKQYRILLRLQEEDRQNMNDILDLTIINRRNEPVVLRNVVTTISQEGPRLLERKDQQRIIYINANFEGRDMGSIVKDIRQKLREVPIPKDFTVLVGGDYEEQQRSFRELIFGFILAVLLVYLVMTGQFESFVDPFVILFSIPMAIIGIVITMILTNTTFSIQALIGCTMLAGIVVNNAILLVDSTNRLRRDKGMNLREAVVTAGSLRLRPILMTTFTTVLGLLPLSFGLGEGGEAQAPLARVVIGGLLSSTLITLILVPIIYSIFEQKLRKSSI